MKRDCLHCARSRSRTRSRIAGNGNGNGEEEIIPDAQKSWKSGRGMVDGKALASLLPLLPAGELVGK